MKGCCFILPPMRPEITTAQAEMEATGQFFAFAAIPSFDKKNWRTWAKTGTTYYFLDGSFSSKEEAYIAGQTWKKERIEAQNRTQPGIAQS